MFRSWGKYPPVRRGIWNFAGGIFLLGGENLTIQTFFKAKNSMLWILTSIKIKISMACVSKSMKLKQK